MSGLEKVAARRLALVIGLCGVAAAVNSCAGLGPNVVMETPRSITVGYDLVKTHEAMQLVKEHCEKYGREAVRTMTDDKLYRTETYECK